MGTFSDIINMLTKFTKLSPASMDIDGEYSMKKIEAIILSMTMEERRNPTIINGSRRRRIAQGSGTTTTDVNQLLNQFHQLQRLTKMASKGTLPKNLIGMIK